MIMFLPDKYSNIASKEDEGFRIRLFTSSSKVVDGSFIYLFKGLPRLVAYYIPVVGYYKFGIKPVEI